MTSTEMLSAVLFNYIISTETSRTAIFHNMTSTEAPRAALFHNITSPEASRAARFHNMTSTEAPRAALFHNIAKLWLVRVQDITIFLDHQRYSHSYTPSPQLVPYTSLVTQPFGAAGEKKGRYFGQKLVYPPCYATISLVTRGGYECEYRWYYPSNK